ncbi:unnamed protein product [Rotaria sp. Silwood1]|nr:unnamed protein product [Rotaria sp. Silwood1]CAF5020435.1 unnamed protein product [Rotaria sp. Silwood1]
MGCTGSKGKKKFKDTSSRKSSSSSVPYNKDINEINLELSDSMLENLLSKTKFTRQEIIDWWQGFLVDCPSGLLDKHKFVEVYQYRYPAGKAKGFPIIHKRHLDKRKILNSSRRSNIDYEYFLSFFSIQLSTRF